MLKISSFVAIQFRKKYPARRPEPSVLFSPSNNEFVVSLKKEEIDFTKEWTNFL
jgi:hypothetical protein